MRFNLLLLIPLIICGFGFLQFGPTSPAITDAEPPLPTAPEETGEGQASTIFSLISPADEAEVETSAGDRAFENGLPLAARVNNQPLYLDVYEQHVARFEQILKARQVDPDSQAGQTQLAQLEQQVLNSLLDQLIIEQQAETLGIHLTDQETQAKVQESVSQAGDQGQFEAWLNQNRLTYDSLIDEVRSELIAGRVFEQVTQAAPGAAEQVRLRYIRVADQATALALMEQLRGGADFVQLAQTQSLDQAGQINGSDSGWVPRHTGLIPAQVETVAFSLNPGDISGPIQTAQGFYVIKLEDKEGERPLTTELQQILKKQIFEEWLREKRAATAIEKYIAWQ
jgi:parvulin-like peptidyl-prolyl isomerase